MAFFDFIEEDQAVGIVADEYDFLSYSYMMFTGERAPTPNVFRPASLVPSHFHFGAEAFRTLAGSLNYDRSNGPVTGSHITYATSAASACFY